MSEPNPVLFVDRLVEFSSGGILQIPGALASISAVWNGVEAPPVAGCRIQKYEVVPTLRGRVAIETDKAIYRWLSAT